MAEPSQDRFAAPDSSGGSSAAFPRWAAARQAGSDELDPAPLLLPGPNESPVAYLARLKGLHERLGALIATIEQRRGVQPAPLPPRVPFSARAAVAMPAPAVAPPPAAAPFDDTPAWPERERRAGRERRIGAVTRRHGLRDRRRGLPDARAERSERRIGPRDRRIGVDDRRRGLDRRGDARREPWQRPGFQLNATTMVWVVQVVAWATIAIVALVYGLGHS